VDGRKRKPPQTQNKPRAKAKPFQIAEVWESFRARRSFFKYLRDTQLRPKGLPKRRFANSRRFVFEVFGHEALK
jgi:hypothetical protein